MKNCNILDKISEAVGNDDLTTTDLYETLAAYDPPVGRKPTITFNDVMWQYYILDTGDRTSLTQEQVAEAVGIYQPDVSKKLKQAEAWLVKRLSPRDMEEDEHD